MFVFKAAVVGAGTMGGEIAQAIAAADIDVVLKDVDQKFVDVGLEKAREVTKGQLDRLVKKEKITQEQADAQLEATLGRIHGTTSYDGFGDVDFVIEAVPERMELKQAVFQELDELTPGHAILASNTSSLSITTIADATSRPHQVLGFHFFYPASVMPLVEIVVGDDTAPETTAAAVNFAQKIRKQPITCADEPGFVVNRILNSSVSEVWRAQEEQGLSIKKIDEQIQGANLAPMGPFFLVDLLGLDTVFHVAEHLNDQFGERFYVHEGMRRLVESKQLGAKTGGSGFYKDGEPQLEGEKDPPDELPELMGLKAVREACLVLEEGVAAARAIDLGMMAGAGMDPRRGIMPPLMRSDVEGLDSVLEKMERAYNDHGDRFAPPAILRRLVAQGRLGTKSGQGFFPWPQPSEGFTDPPVQLEKRDGYAIAWLNNPPANSLSPEVVAAIASVWEAVEADSAIRALIFASANPLLFCAGADIKAFTKMDESSGRELIELGHGMLRAFEQSSTVTIAAVNAIAYGGGCELAMACDFRIAAESALFAQPEINLGIIPGFGGTQRLPRLVGESKALEMNLSGDAILAEDAYEFGLVNQVVDDHELIDVAVLWARKLGGQAPLAVEKVKQISGAGDLDAGIEAEKEGFAAVFQSEDAREGIGAFLGEEDPEVERVLSGVAQLADLIREAESVVALTGAGISVPSGIPDFRSPGTGLWENVDPMEVAHIDAFRADPVRFWQFYGTRFDTLDGKEPNGAHHALVELERRGLLHAVVTQNIDRLHRKAGTRELVEVHGTIDRSVCLDCDACFPVGDVRARLDADMLGVPRCDCGRPLKPDVVLFGEFLPEGALETAFGLAAGADVLLCIGSSLEVYPIAQLPSLTRQAGGAVAIVTAGETPFDSHAAVRLSGDVVAELQALLEALT